MCGCFSVSATALKIFTGKVSFVNPHPESHLRFRVHSGVNPSNLAFIRRNCLHSLVSASSSSFSDSQVEFEFADKDKVQLQLQLPDNESSWVVHIRLQLQKECRFGEQFLVAGDHPTLGMWSPSDAAPMVWSDGHVWTAELDLPVGQLIQFKFVLRKISGRMVWQPGPNRILQTTRTSSLIRVFGDWENVTVQHVIEENVNGNQYGEADEVMIDEMRQLREHVGGKMQPMMESYNRDVTSFNGQAMAMVAQNITYHTAEDGAYWSKKLQVERTLELSGNGVVSKKVISHTVKDEIAVSNNNTGLRRRENIIDINGGTQPVLVPGLSSCLNMITPYVTAKEVRVHLNTSHKLDQKEEEKEDKWYRSREQTTNGLMLDEHRQIQNMNKPGFADSNEQHQGLEIVQYRDWEHKSSSILHNGVKWGQERLTTLLNNLGLGFIFREIK